MANAFDDMGAGFFAHGGPSKAPVQVTDADRKDPALAGLSDEEITNAKTPVGDDTAAPATSTNSFDDMGTKFFSAEAPPPEPPPVKQPGFFDKAGKEIKKDAAAFTKGAGGELNRGITSTMVAAGGIPVIADWVSSKVGELFGNKEPSTQAQDWWFKNFVEPSVANQRFYDVGKKANFGEKASDAIGSTLGMIAEIMGTGGAGAEARVATEAVPSALELTGQTVQHASKAMAVPAVADAVDEGRQVFQQTGDSAQALKAAQVKYLTTVVGGMIPLSKAGGLATRAVSGAASGVVTGELGRTAQNAVEPQERQQPFSAEDTAISALTGAVGGAALGPRAEPSALPGFAEHSTASAIDTAQQAAREHARAAGGDNLDQEVAAAMAAAAASEHHAKGFDEVQKNLAPQIEQANQDYDQGMAQLDEDNARNQIQQEAASRYEAEINRRADMERAFQDQAAQKAQQENAAYAQREMQSAPLPAEGPATTNLGDAGLNDLLKPQPEAPKTLAERRAAEQPSNRVTFQTEKGSTYEVNEQGQTVRNKAARPEHPGDEGMKPASEATYYVSPEDAQRLGEFQAEGGPKRSIEKTADGRIGVKYLSGKDGGKFERRTVVKPETEPREGLTPIETWNQGREVHFGNKIVKVTRPEVKTEPKALPAPKVDRIEVNKEGVARPVTEAELSQRGPQNGLSLRRAAMREERPRPSVKEVQAPIKETVDAAAHEAAPSPKNELEAPSVQQSFAGNFKMGHTEVQGMPVTVEYPKGSKRPYIDDNGQEQSHEMPDHYGYFKGTKGADGQHVDVMIGDQPENKTAYVIDHLDRSNGQFEQHKVLMGYPNRLAAMRSFKKAFPDNPVGPVKEMSTDELKSWLKDGDTTKPLQPDKLPKADRSQKPGARGSKLRYAEAPISMLDRVGERRDAIKSQMDALLNDKSRPMTERMPEYRKLESQYNELASKAEAMATKKADDTRQEFKNFLAERRAAREKLRYASNGDARPEPGKMHLHEIHAELADLSKPKEGLSGLEQRRVEERKSRLNLELKQRQNSEGTGPRYREGAAALKEVPEPRQSEANPAHTPEESKLFDDLHSHVNDALDATKADFGNKPDTLRVRRDQAKLEKLRDEAEQARKETPTGEVKPKVRELYEKAARVTNVDHTPLELTTRQQGDTIKPRVSVDQAHEALKDLKEKAPGIEPEVVDHPRNAPEHVQSQMLQDGQMDARGVYDPETDKVYIFSDNHDSPEEVQRTAVHEGVAHKGLRRLLGDDFSSVMKDVYDKAADRAWIDDFMQQHGMDPSDETHKGIAAEEYAASLAEHADMDAPLLRRVVDVVRAGLRKLGAKIKWTDDDIRHLLRKSYSGLAKTSPHARSVGRNLRYATKDYAKAVRTGADHPLSVAFKFGATMEEQANHNPGFVRSRVDAIRDFGDRNIDKVLALIPRRNLPDFMSPGKMPSTHDYVREVQRMDGRRNELLQKADDTAKRWVKYTSENKAGARTLGELMHAATLAEVDPSRPYQPRYSGKRKQADGSFKEVPLKDEQTKIESDRQKQWSDLRRHWEKLDQQGKAIYSEVRDSYATDRNMIRETLEKRINETNAEGKVKQALINELRAKFEEGRTRGPYFPLARFGDYWGSAKDGEGSTVAFTRFESRSEQKAWRVAMKKAGYATDGGKKMDNGAMVTRIDPTFVAKVTDLLKEVDPEMADDIWQHYLRSMPEMSMRKHFIHRKGRLGFTADALRAFGYQKFHGAHQIAKLEYGNKLDNIMDKMKVEARDLEVKNDPESHWAVPLAEEFAQRHEWAKRPQSSTLATKLTGLGFAYYLGATPAAALVNLSQNAMVAFPTLAAKHNALGAGIELSRSMKQYAGALGDLSGRLRGDERAAYDEAKRIGLFSKTQAHDLAGISEEGMDYGSKRRKAAAIGSYLFSAAEEMNRQTTFLAAYRLARKAGMSHEDAILHGEDITWDSHFDYSNTNRARILQNDTAKVLFLFRQYAANMTYRLARDFNNGVLRNAATPDLRNEAAIRFTGMLGQALIWAGASGMPLWWLGTSTLNQIFGSQDQPFDAEAALRHHVHEQLGKTASQAIFDGPVNAISGAGVSSRVGMNNMWMQDPPPGLEGKNLALFYTGQIAGPVANIGVKLAQGAQSLGEGQPLKAMEQATPKVMSDLLKAFDYARNGVTNERGDTVVPREKLNDYDLFLQSIGFTPAKVALAQTQNRATKDMATEIAGRKKELRQQLFLSMQNDDTQAFDDAQAAIGKFNEANPTMAFNAKQEFDSIKSRINYSNQSVNGLYVEPGLRYLYDKMDFSSEE